MTGTTSPLEMSDEDFLKLSPPETGEAAQADPANIPDNGSEPKVEDPAAQAAAQTPADNKAADEKPGAEGEGDTTNTNNGGQEPKGNNAQEPGADPNAEPAKTEGESAAPGSKPEGETGKDPADPAGEKPGEKSEVKPFDFKASYEKIMAPFKANGKTIELRSPEEAIQLMQMGANYTKKLQELQPHKKLLLMLQNNELLDEGKLSYLIDLDKKNPEAIKKLIKDSGVDPLDIDTSTEPAYREGSHIVPDAQVAFVTKLEEVTSNPGGTEMLNDIHANWDQASKDALWENPEILSIIHGQRENGIYAKITTELDRQRTLGTIPATMPFLQAYKVVGDELEKSNAFADLVKPSPAQTPENTQAVPEPKVVAERVAAPKSEVTNGDRVGAAAPTRATTTGAKTQVNPLAMSDDEFMKNWQGRL